MYVHAKTTDNRLTLVAHPGLSTPGDKVVGLDPRFLHAVMARESSHNPGATSEAGAVGLMQVLPATFEEVRPEVERLLGRPAVQGQPLDDLAAGAVYYKHQLDATNGDVEQAARRYHGGPDKRQWGPRTIAYGRAVRGTYARFKGVTGSATGG